MRRIPESQDDGAIFTREAAALSRPQKGPLTDVERSPVWTLHGFQTTNPAVSMWRSVFRSVSQRSAHGSSLSLMRMAPPTAVAAASHITHQRILFSTTAQSSGSSKSSSSNLQYFLDDNCYDTLRKGDPQPADKNKDLKGWELVVKRTRDVIDALCDKDINKILHINCNPDLVKALGDVSLENITFLSVPLSVSLSPLELSFSLTLDQVNNISLGGCTDNVEDYNLTK
jgi:hypothetical protein